MKEQVRILVDSLFNYQKLDYENQKHLKRWIGMTFSFLITAGKFIFGCLFGGGYLCVSVLYSFLIGFSKYKRLHYAVRNHRHKKPQNLFFENGVIIFLAGTVYSIYMARLLISPKNGHWTLPLGITVALFCFIDIGIAVRNLWKVDKQEEEPLLVLARKLSGIASALPAFVFANIAITGFTSETDPSYGNGVLGIIVGVVMMAMGAGMMVYSNKHRNL